MSEGRSERPCPYCGARTREPACALHRELVTIDRELSGAGAPLSETDLGLAELELQADGLEEPAKGPRVARSRRRA